MKKILSVLVLVSAMVTFAAAQSETRADVSASGPAIEFEATTVDYGTIEQGSDPFRIFTFTNTGNEPLVIKNAKGSCGCTVPEWPKEPVSPGKTGEIKVRYDTNRIGPINKTVTLTTNAAGAGERVTLVIKGEVQKKDAEPSGLPEKAGSPFNNGGSN